MAELVEDMVDHDDDPLFDSFQSYDNRDIVIIRDTIKSIKVEKHNGTGIFGFYGNWTYVEFKSTMDHRGKLPLYDIDFIGDFKEGIGVGSEIVVLIEFESYRETDDRSDALINVYHGRVFRVKDFNDYKHANKIDFIIFEGIIIFCSAIFLASIIAYGKKIKENVNIFWAEIKFSMVGGLVILLVIICFEIFSRKFIEYGILSGPHLDIEAAAFDTSTGGLIFDFDFLPGFINSSVFGVIIALLMYATSSCIIFSILQLFLHIKRRWKHKKPKSKVELKLSAKNE